jgi:ribosomal protein S18 acetylase RimI-like enzyme
MNNIHMKKAEIGDLDIIETMYNDSIEWLDSQNIHQWNKEVYPTRNSANRALEEGSLYCCYFDERIVGTFIINEDQPTQYEALKWKYTSGKALVIHTLVVSPKEAGKGIGRAIVEYIFEYAMEQNYTCIRLDVFPDNKAAVKLYLAFGFEYVGKVFFETKEPGHEWYDCYEKLI